MTGRRPERGPMRTELRELGFEARPNDESFRCSYFRFRSMALR